MKKIFTNLFLLATFFLASTNLNAQTYIINDSGSYEVMTSGSSSKTKTFTISNPRPCDQLTFDNSQSTDWWWPATGGVTVTATYTDGTSSEIASGKGNGSHSVSLNRKIVKELSFKGTGTLKKTISNIKLTMATYADAPAASSLTAPTATVDSPDDETEPTTMAWCNTSPFTLSISGEGKSQFEYSISNNASAGNYGTATITATYKHNKVGTHTATLTVKTALGTHNIALIGETTLKAQTITWNIADADTKLPLNKIVENAATTISGLPITYTSSDETIIKIINNGTAFQAIKAGTATITATQAGNEKWDAAPEKSKEFTVTAKQIQSIVWEGGNLTRLKTGSEPITLSAKVQLTVNAETGEKVDSPERTARLTYASANNNIVSVTDSTYYRWRRRNNSHRKCTR